MFKEKNNASNGIFHASCARAASYSIPLYGHNTSQGLLLQGLDAFLLDHFSMLGHQARAPLGAQARRPGPHHPGRAVHRMPDLVRWTPKACGGRL